MPQSAFFTTWLDRLWALKTGFEVKSLALHAGHDGPAAESDTDDAYDQLEDLSVDYVSGFAGAG